MCRAPPGEQADADRADPVGAPGHLAQPLDDGGQALDVAVVGVDEAERLRRARRAELGGAVVDRLLPAPRAGVRDAKALAGDLLVDAHDRHSSAAPPTSFVTYGMMRSAPTATPL